MTRLLSGTRLLSRSFRELIVWQKSVSQKPAGSQQANLTKELLRRALK